MSDRAAGPVRVLSQRGEIIVAAGLTDAREISRRLLETYPDEFDAICAFTTFRTDHGGEPWYQAVRSDVQGIGAPPLDMARFWGSGPGGRLAGFINMQNLSRYGDHIGAVGGPVHALVAEEFGHRWGAFLRYVDGDGVVSGALLGREGAHWANTVQAAGSLLDGSEWVEVEPGQFWLKARAYRFSELDQYAMGLRAADEVSDFFRIADARFEDAPIDPSWPLAAGVTVSGVREEITMAQIVAANGPRVPDYTESRKAFRMAVVLITPPNESDQVVAEAASRLEAFRAAFEAAIFEMTDGRMRMCTRVSGPCGYGYGD